MKTLVSAILVLAFAPQWIATQSDENLLSTANAAYESDRYVEALDVYSEYVADSTADGIVWYRMGYSYESIYDLDIVSKTIYSVANHLLTDTDEFSGHRYIEFSNGKMNSAVSQHGLETSIKAVISSIDNHGSFARYAIFFLNLHTGIILASYLAAFALVFVIALVKRKSLILAGIAGILSPLLIVYFVAKLLLMYVVLRKTLGKVGDLVSGGRRSKDDQRPNHTRREYVKRQNNQTVGMIDYKPDGEIIGRSKNGKSLAIYRPSPDETVDASNGKRLYKGNNVKHVIWEHADS